MAQSYSDSSEESDSDSSKEETIYDTIRATAQKPGGARAEEGQAHALVLRIIIEDLQQTVSPPPAARVPAHGRHDLGSRGLCSPPAPTVPEALLLLPPPHERPAHPLLLGPPCWWGAPHPPFPRLWLSESWCGASG